MLIHQINHHKKKITFPPNLTYGQTDGRTDISNYRVASLLKIESKEIDIGLLINYDILYLPLGRSRSYSTINYKEPT